MDAGSIADSSKHVSDGISHHKVLKIILIDWLIY